MRGGFSRSVLATSDEASARWRDAFITTCLERDIPQLGPRIPSTTLRRFWTMLAHRQGALLNASDLARALAVDGKTVAAYIDLTVDLLLLRRLPPLHANVGKRLTRSPKVYLGDSGRVHALLRLDTLEDVLSHPVAGASFEGHVIETLIRASPPRTQASFYHTAAGAKIDPVLDMPGGRRWVIEISRLRSGDQAPEDWKRDVISPSMTSNRPGLSSSMTARNARGRVRALKRSVWPN